MTYPKTEHNNLCIHCHIEEKAEDSEFCPECFDLVDDII